MIMWFDKLYIDESLKKHKKRCMKQIEAQKLWKRSYTVIVLASNEEDLYDIMESREMFFKYYRRKKVYIAGVAENPESALELLQQMLLDSYEKGEFSPRRTFSKEHFVCG